MRDLATAMIIAVSGIVLMTVASGNGFCMSNDDKLDLGDSSVCLNETNIFSIFCRIQCIFCHLGKVQRPYGCLKESGNETVCHCIGKESSGGNGTATPTEQPTTELPANTTGGDPGQNISNSSPAPTDSSAPEGPITL